MLEKKNRNGCQLHVSSPDFCSEMSTFVSPVLSGRQKQLRRFRFHSFMEIKCHGNILASSCVLICHNVHVCALSQSFRKSSVWTQAPVLDAVIPKPLRFQDGNKITQRECRPRHCFLSAVFSSFSMSSSSVRGSRLMMS